MAPSRPAVQSGTEIPEAIRTICHANIDVQKIIEHWAWIVHLVASVHTGHTSAVHAPARFGSAARGDPLYEAMVQLGKLLRTVFLADYFVNASFRRKLPPNSCVCSIAARPSTP